MGPSPLEHLFNPKSIAVFGASNSGGNVGSKLLRTSLKVGLKKNRPHQSKTQKGRGP